MSGTIWGRNRDSDLATGFTLRGLLGFFPGMAPLFIMDAAAPVDLGRVIAEIIPHHIGILADDTSGHGELARANSGIDLAPRLIEKLAPRGPLGDIGKITLAGAVDTIRPPSLARHFAAIGA